MKQGSTDDPFAEDDEDPDMGASDDGVTLETDESSGGGAQDDASIGAGPDTGDVIERGSLPFIHARDGVKDGRTQRPVFLRDHVENGIDDLVDHVEAELGEDVYKTDVTEAAMVVAQENPELVRSKLEEWGYGWS